MSSNKRTTLQKQEMFLESLRKNLFIVTSACQQSGISRTQYYQWLKDPIFKEKVDEVIELQGDFVETQLLKRIKEGSDQSIIFYLKTKGRKRGYIDRLEIEGSFDIKGITTIELIEYKKNEGDDKTEKE